MQIITPRQLFLMGADRSHLSVLRRVPLLIRWDESGYRMDGAVTARGLSAAEVLRYILALKNYRQ